MPGPPNAPAHLATLGADWLSAFLIVLVLRDTLVAWLCACAIQMQTCSWELLKLYYPIALLCLFLLLERKR
jgi:hypothetical protein